MDINIIKFFNFPNRKFNKHLLVFNWKWNNCLFLECQTRNWINSWRSGANNKFDDEIDCLLNVNEIKYFVLVIIVSFCHHNNNAEKWWRWLLEIVNNRESMSDWEIHIGYWESNIKGVYFIHQPIVGQASIAISMNE